MTESKQTAPTPEARAVWPPDRDTLRFRIGSALSHAYDAGKSGTEFLIGEVSCALVPPVPTQPRRVRVGNADVSVNTMEDAAAFPFLLHCGFNVIAASFLEALQTVVRTEQMQAAAQLLDLIANPREPSPAAPVPVALSDEELWALAEAVRKYDKGTKGCALYGAMRAALAVAE